MRTSTGWRMALATVAILWAGEAGAIVPHRGLWQLVVTHQGQDLTLALVRVEERDGKAVLTVVDTGPPTLKDAVAGPLEVDAQSLRFTLEAGATRYRVEALADTGPDKGRLLRGTLVAGGQIQVVRLERSVAAALDLSKLVRRTDGADLLRQARALQDPAAEDALCAQAAKDFPGKPVVYLLARQVAERRWRAGASKEAIEAAMTRAVAAAAPYGPTLVADCNLDAARRALASDRTAGLAIGYARAAVAALGPDAPTARRADALRVLLTALEKERKTEEIPAIRAQLALLEERLDAEVRKETVPFDVRLYGGRLTPSKRVAIVELFTNAQSPACAAAELAGGALLERYAPSDVLYLCYHLSDYDPDALANPSTEARAAFYGVTSTPSVFIDGRRGPPLAGFRAQARARYAALEPRVDEAIEVPEKAEVRLETTRPTPDTVRIRATATLPGGAPAEARVVLRLLLIEDEVRYLGGNGQRLHRHVVRACPGGVEGLPFADGKADREVMVDLAALKRDLDAALTKAARDRPFPEGERPLNLRHLAVVALVQDDATKEVWQAAVVKVEERK